VLAHVKASYSLDFVPCLHAPVLSAPLLLSTAMPHENCVNDLYSFRAEGLEGAAGGAVGARPTCGYLLWLRWLGKTALQLEQLVASSIRTFFTASMRIKRHRLVPYLAGRKSCR
jgi:hypothetical protein